MADAYPRHLMVLCSFFVFYLSSSTFVIEDPGSLSCLS